MIYLTRIEKFNAAHKLWVEEWSDEKNKEIFGKCANANWHGHNFTLHVTVKGSPDPMTGFIMNAKDLGRLIKDEVIEYLDHRNLNLDVEFIPDDIQPTTENLVKIIWQRLDRRLNECELHRIKLVETDKIYAEYYGENEQ